jgi:hypothetical protein
MFLRSITTALVSSILGTFSPAVEIPAPNSPATVYFDSTTDDEERRKRLYNGALFVLPPSSSSLALCEFAREMIREAFGPLDPLKAQYSLPVEEYANILSRLKPKFIHHPNSKLFIQSILREHGCDLDRTYFDVPRMRTSTSDNYLTSGIAYAWHPHRDTWYSAPQCQLKLVAANLRDRSERRIGLSFSVLGGAGKERLKHLQLLRVEQNASGGRRELCQAGPAAAASSAKADRTRSANPPGWSGWRNHSFLRGTAPFHRTQCLGQDSV